MDHAPLAEEEEGEEEEGEEGVAAAREEWNGT